MSKKDLEDYLYQNIPLSKAMGVQVEEASLDQVILFAPLALNINHQKTAFGGSLQAIATLACWSLLYLNIKETEQRNSTIVIAKSQIHYRLAVEGDFRAQCNKPDLMNWHHFLKMLQLKGKGRLNLQSYIVYKGHKCVAFQGLFVTLP